MRDLGTEGAHLPDVGIKSAIEKDIIPGPRLLVTTRAIVATGSYAPRNFAPEWRIPQGADEADEDHLRTLVRRQIREGTDWIKIYVDAPHGLGPNPKPAFSKESFKAALESGVLIGNGSDIGVFPHGQGYQELEMLVKYGMTPLQALRCATSDASKLLDLQNKVGIVKEGMIADLAAFEGDPSKEIKDVRKVKFVMKSGNIYKQP